MNTSEIHRSLQAFVFRPGEVTTSWEVLERVKAMAVDEPKRLRMKSFLLLRGLREAEAPYGIEWPACGTVGCFCGFGSITLRQPLTEGHIGDTLGLTNQQICELFYPTGWSNGTQCNARTIIPIINHITAFQAKYEQQLRDHRIEVSR